MAHEHVYGICENKCMVEVPSKDEFNAIGMSGNMIQFGHGRVELNETTKDVTFDVPFATLPEIVVTALTANPSKVNASVINRTANGFTCTIMREAGATASGTGFSWIAIGRA